MLAARTKTRPRPSDENSKLKRWSAGEGSSIRADCTDAWKKAAKTEQFRGTQEQVLELLKYTEPVTAIRILDAFLGAGLGTERSYADTKTPPQPVRTGSPNGWGLYNMHGNAFEWTIAVDKQADLPQIFDALETGNREWLESKNPQAFFLAGGGYNYSLAQQIDGWVKFSIWGGERLDEKNEKPQPYAFAELEELSVDNPSGFRIVLERVLALNWLYAVRDAALPVEPAGLTAVEEQLARIKETVQELSTSSEADLAIAKIDYYQALATYRAGKAKEASEILAKKCGALAGENEYFRYLTTLATMDAAPHL